jgi:hypothetical protein
MIDPHSFTLQDEEPAPFLPFENKEVLKRQWNSELIRGRYAKSGTNEPNFTRIGENHNSCLERILRKYVGEIRT